MGSWTITVHGHGSHHNRKTESYDPAVSDANRLAARFVEELRKAGHVVGEARFTLVGGEDNIAEADYLDKTQKRDG